MQVQCHLGPGPVCIVALMAASLAISFTGPLCWAGLISKFQFPPSSRPQAFTWPLGLLMKLWPQRDPPLDSVSTQVGYRHYMFGSWLLYFPESYLWQAAYPEPHSSSSDHGSCSHTQFFYASPHCQQPLGSDKTKLSAPVSGEPCPPPNSYVDVLTPSISKSNHIWT